MPADYLSRNLVSAISWEANELLQAQAADPLIRALKNFLLNKELPHDAKCQALVKLFSNDCFVEDGLIWRRIKRQGNIKGDIALKLGRFFNTGAEIWMNLQKAYELDLAREKLGNTLEKIIPYQSLSSG